MVKMLKGISARKLFLKFLNSRKTMGGHLWNPTYFVSTISENTEAQVRKYIETLLTVPYEETLLQDFLRKMISSEI